MLGREVATLVDDSRPAGHYDVVWNADRVASGVYLCRLTAGGFSEVRKMMVMH
jgi:hypothetical protein